MAWRSNEQLIDGYLDNTEPGKVTGHLRFVGMSEMVRLNLEGDFHRDIRGAVLLITKCGTDDRSRREGYMEGFSSVQNGDAGDITAGLSPMDYVGYPYIEWYSLENGRVVLELEPNEVEVIGTPLVAGEQDPLDREKQTQLLGRFLARVAADLGKQNDS